MNQCLKGLELGTQWRLCPFDISSLLKVLRRADAAVQNITDEKCGPNNFLSFKIAVMD